METLALALLVVAATQSGVPDTRIATQPPRVVNLGINVPFSPQEDVEPIFAWSGRFAAVAATDPVTDALAMHVIDTVTGEVHVLDVPTYIPPFGTVGDTAVIDGGLLASQTLQEDGSARITLHDIQRRQTRVLPVGLTRLGFQQIRGGFVTGVSEYDTGDWNGDGDTDDTVLQIISTRPEGEGPTAPGSFELLTTPRFACVDFVANETGTMIAVVDESGEFETDLNGDGDTDDYVATLVDLRSGSLRNLGVAARRLTPTAVGSRLIGFSVSEAQQGVDLNSDGDLGDDVAHVVDLSLGTLTNLGVVSTIQMVTSDRWMAFTVPEREQAGMDLNNDGDTFDALLALYDADSGTLVETRIDSRSFEFFEGALYFTAYQASGFLTTAASTLRVDLTNGALRSLEFHNVAKVTDDLVYLSASERIASVDLNGDGDAEDNAVASFLRRGDRTPLATGLAVDRTLSPFFESRVQADQGRAAFLVKESFQAEDLDGDGVISSAVSTLHVFDAATGLTTNTALPSTGGYFALMGSRALVAVSEWTPGGGVDLDGDGQISGYVVHLIDLD